MPQQNEVEVMMDQEEQDQEEQQNQEQQSDQPPVENQSTDPLGGGIDFRQLYLEQQQERARLEAELNYVQQQRRQQEQSPRSQEPPVTAEDLAGEQAPQAIRRIVADALRDQLGDVAAMSRQYKAEQAMLAAETQAFRQEPMLAPYREQLAPAVRASVAASGMEPTPALYRLALQAQLGQLSMQAAMGQGNLPGNPSLAAPQNKPPAAPVSQQPPANRPRTPSSTPRVTEAEKTYMRRAGLDPSKTEDVTRFQSLIADGEFSV